MVRDWIDGYFAGVVMTVLFEGVGIFAAYAFFRLTKKL